MRFRDGFDARRRCAKQMTGIAGRNRDVAGDTMKALLLRKHGALHGFQVREVGERYYG